MSGIYFHKLASNVMDQTPPPLSYNSYRRTLLGVTDRLDRHGADLPTHVDNLVTLCAELIAKGEAHDPAHGLRPVA